MADSKISSVIPNNSIKDIYPRKPTSTVYIENSNNTSSLEDIMFVNDLTQGFPSGNVFGSNNTFRFSRTYQFLNGIIAKFTVQYPGDSTTTVHGEYFGYNLIKRLRWTAGGTELLTLSGESLVPIILDQCESFHKKCIVLEESGVKKVANTSVSLNATAVTYTAVLPLPFSAINAKKLDNMFKPFPLHMLSEPLELQIELRDLIDVASFGAITLTSSELQFQYGKIGNPEQLKKSVYKYPFASIFSNIFPYTFVDANTEISVDLNGFRRAEVNMIQIVAAPTAVINRNEGMKMNDISLTFNGQVIWRSAGNDQIWDLIYNCQPSVHGYKKYGILTGAQNVVNAVVAEGATSVIRNKTKLASIITDKVITGSLVEFYGHSNLAATAVGENGLYYYYNIPIAEILQKYAGCGHVLGADFSKQSIQLKFKVPAAGRLQVAYYYKAMYQFDNEQALLIY